MRAIFPTRSRELVPRQDLVFDVYATTDLYGVLQSVKSFKMQSVISRDQSAMSGQQFGAYLFSATLISLIVSQKRKCSKVFRFGAKFNHQNRV